MSSDLYAQTTVKRILILIALLACAACSGENDNAHTTATTVVPPPPQQVLHAEMRPGPQTPPVPDGRGKYDPAKPLFVVNLPNDKTIREGEALAIDFSLASVKLRGDGGEYRIRYMVDDDDMQWIDRWEQLVLTGWVAGKHTIRFELIGPDGWPYRNGDYNVVAREITVVK